ncbi:LysM peptidoglycan-binding domain-containing protein [Paenibacillus sp. LX16]|uniref:LysM peptidoglycan-binding domain-containing protein n=1 Tax=Paenibacillus sp. LX16 TaxID=1740264 RepID=UPI002E28D63E|nr:LysM peptidoglycan-binding domain-containing protein [Paenibacillus sp. LX16]
MAEYGIYLSYNNQEEGFQLPIVPGKIEISSGGKGSTYDVSKLGEINVIKDPALKEYSFESFFPASPMPFTSGTVFEPSFYKDLIEKWMGTKRPIRFIFVGSTFEINTPASIEQFDWSEQSGAVGDIFFSLKLKEYKFYSAQKVVVQQTTATRAGSNTAVAKKKTRADSRNKLKTYTLKPGDTLIGIARKVLGDDSKWRAIQAANSLTDAQLKSLPVGKVLKMPT